jgi:tryptophan synthase alpha chain
MESLQENGADLVGMGMPYSDPLADGEVINEQQQGWRMV